MYFTINYKDIKVSYWWLHGGGGNIFAHEFVHIISQKIGKVEHVFEYCAGPAYIGFCLLANNLCDRLTLADVNPAVRKGIEKTIRDNHLEDRVTFYQSDCLAAIPEHERWDLVVSNPPWYLSSGNNIRVYDPEGRIHREFYRDVSKFLKPNGSVLFVEGGEYTDTGDFQDMIEGGGLKVVETIRYASFPDIFRNLDEYKGLKASFAMFLRSCLFFREVYFIWSKRR